MPFTGVPGSANARPGNTVPGLGGATNALAESASNTLVLTQTVAVSVTYNRTVSQSLTLVSRAGQAYVPTASNSLTLLSTAVADLRQNTHLDQTLTLTQVAVGTVSRSVEASNFLMIAAGVTTTQQFNREVSQSLTLVDLALRVIDETVPHTLTLTQSVTVVKVKSTGIAQPLLLSQTAVTAVDYGRVVSQGLAITQTATKTVRRVVAATSSLNLTQNAVGIATKRASSTLTLTQDATVVLVKRATSTLELTQSVHENHTLSKRMFDVLPVFQTLALNATFRRTVAHSLTITQSATVSVVRPASNHLNLSQEALGVRVKPGFSTITLVQDVDLNVTLRKPVTHSLSLTHAVQVTKLIAVTASNVLAFEQHARGTRVLTESVVSSLVLSQEMYRVRYPESVPTPLVLTQTAVGHKIAPRATSNVLALTHSVAVSKTLNRSVNHSLVFATSFLKQVGLPGQPTVSVPTVQAVKVQSLVILESGQYVIVLPAPEFNDKEAGTGRINIKRAMDGTRRIYKREQPASRLVYDFIMDRAKAIELRTFIMNTNSSVIRMTNWKGEIWMAVFTNSPFQFAEDALWQSAWGNKCSVTLEFQGVKIN
jgi:hypothetical protein